MRDSMADILYLERLLRRMSYCSASETLPEQ